MEEKIQLQDQIEHYLQGQLSEEEVDSLWIEFLKTPEWYDYYLTAINLKALFRKRKSGIFF